MFALSIVVKSINGKLNNARVQRGHPRSISESFQIAGNIERDLLHNKQN